MTNQPEHRHPEDRHPEHNPDAFHYQAFLVRLWKDGEIALWRGSAQSVQAGEIVRFASLTALFTYLESQTSDSPEAECRVRQDVHLTRKQPIRSTDKSIEKLRGQNHESETTESN